MDITLERGRVYYCKDLKLLCGTTEITIKDKYILILQGGYFFKKTNKVNILLGTSQKIDINNIYPTDVLIKASVDGFPKDTKFNCAEVYIMHKVDVLKSEYKFKLNDNDMMEINKTLILGLQIS
jgi:mRNA-degrading endonuclease toxin of MazEF toxin-antitoxin module